MRRGTNALLTVLLALPALPLAGCSSYQPPTFEAIGVREVERDADHAVLVFVIEATNPNREPMPLGKASYEFSLGDEPVFAGIRSPESTVNTYGTNTFELPVVVPASMTDRTGEVAYTIRGRVLYRNPGALADVLFDAQISRPEAALDLSGTVNLGG
tara:strand:- start:1983 stop:2453 length:471 start_codon:yes stop_codon:yes gene_type:complete